MKKPKKSAARIINQIDLYAIEDMRRQKAHLKSETDRIEAALAQAEREVRDKLADGYTLELGSLAASIEKKNVCNPSYKDELVAHFEQSHGIDRKVVEEQVRARWTKTKEFLAITHRPATIKSVH